MCVCLSAVCAHPCVTPCLYVAQRTQVTNQLTAVGTMESTSCARLGYAAGSSADTTLQSHSAQRTGAGGAGSESTRRRLTQKTRPDLSAAGGLLSRTVGHATANGQCERSAPEPAESSSNPTDEAVTALALADADVLERNSKYICRKVWCEGMWQCPFVAAYT